MTATAHPYDGTAAEAATLVAQYRTAYCDASYLARKLGPAVRAIATRLSGRPAVDIRYMYITHDGDIGARLRYRTSFSPDAGRRSGRIVIPIGDLITEMARMQRTADARRARR
jgi:hypothetical protein